MSRADPGVRSGFENNLDFSACLVLAGFVWSRSVQIPGLFYFQSFWDPEPVDVSTQKKK